MGTVTHLGSSTSEDDIPQPPSIIMGNNLTAQATAEDAVEQTVTVGSSSLSYDPSTDQYIYIWKTDKTWAATCRTLVIKLTDSTYHRANFKFK